MPTIKKGLLALLTGAFLVLAGCGRFETAPEFPYVKMSPSQRQDAALLPTPGFAGGWQAESGVKRYDEETLFGHINGEADIYYPYGFKEVQTVTYLKAGDPATRIQADVYEMGSLLDAFGIYSNYRNPDDEVVPFGAEGVRGEYQVLFYQGPYFVRINAAGAPEALEAALLVCGGAVAERLPGKSRQPSELDLIRVDAVDPRTVKYYASSVLGYGFLERGFVGAAELQDGKEARAFVAMYSGPQAAGGALEAYTAYLIENGADYRWEKAPGGPIILGEDPLHKGMAVQQVGAFLTGVVNLGDPAEGAGLLGALRDKARGG